MDAVNDPWADRLRYATASLLAIGAIIVMVVIRQPVVECAAQGAPAQVHETLPLGTPPI